MIIIMFVSTLELDLSVCAYMYVCAHTPVCTCMHVCACSDSVMYKKL